MVIKRPMLLIAGLLLTWMLLAGAAVVLCVAARRGDEEMASVRPVALHSVDGTARVGASGQTRAS